jgi:5'-3' exonuclease
LSQRSSIQIQQTGDFQMLSINLLREYIRLEFNSKDEAAVDDFVVFCFFVGNDFLPSLPLMEIDENGLSTLIAAYKRCVGRWKRPNLVKDNQIDLANLRDFFNELCDAESGRIAELEKKVIVDTSSNVSSPKQQTQSTEKKAEKQKEAASDKKRKQQKQQPATSTTAVTSEIEGSLKSLLGIGAPATPSSSSTAQSSWSIPPLSS